MKKVFVFLSLIITGCASPIMVNRGTTTQRYIFIPDFNEISTAYVGESIMNKKFGWDVDCITTLAEKKYGYYGNSYLIPEGGKLCGNGTGTNVFTTYDFGTQWSYYNGKIIEVVNEDGSSRLCLDGECSRREYSVTYDQIELKRSTEFKLPEDSLEQSIQFLGRDNNRIKFMYVETRNGAINSIQNREFYIDISDTNMVRFRGAEVEVINVSNSKLDYRINKYFD